VYGYCRSNECVVPLEVISVISIVLLHINGCIVTLQVISVVLLQMLTLQVQ
jgi:hypothetical protein